MAKKSKTRTTAEVHQSPLRIVVAGGNGTFVKTYPVFDESGVPTSYTVTVTRLDVKIDLGDDGAIVCAFDAPEPSDIGVFWLRAKTEIAQRVKPSNAVAMIDRRHLLVPDELRDFAEAERRILARQVVRTGRGSGIPAGDLARRILREVVEMQSRGETIETHVSPLTFGRPKPRTIESLVAEAEERANGERTRRKVAAQELRIPTKAPKDEPCRREPLTKTQELLTGSFSAREIDIIRAMTLCRAFNERSGKPQWAIYKKIVGDGSQGRVDVPTAYKESFVALRQRSPAIIKNNGTKGPQSVTWLTQHGQELAKDKIAIEVQRQSRPSPTNSD